MALGSYNNNKRSGSTELTVYSNLKFSNNQSEVDKTSLSFTLWNSMLGIQLSPILMGADGSVTYDRDNSICIWLSTFKAMILSKEITRFLNGEADNVGVHTRAGIINITRGTEFGANSPCLTIRKLNEDGQVISSYTYQVKTDYHYSIDNFEERAKSAPIFEKHFGYNDIELEMMRIQCDEYVKSMSMANAYATAQVNQRQFKHIEYKINKIGEATGITFDSGNSSYGNKSSYFDSAPNNNTDTDNLANDDFE